MALLLTTHSESHSSCNDIGHSVIQNEKLAN